MLRAMSWVSCGLLMFAVAGWSQEASAKNFGSTPAVKQSQQGHRHYRRASATQARKNFNRQASRNVSGKPRSMKHASASGGRRHHRHHWAGASSAKSRKFNNAGRTTRGTHRHARHHKVTKPTTPAVSTPPATTTPSAPK